MYSIASNCFTGTNRSPERPNTFWKFAISLISPCIHIPKRTSVSTKKLGGVEELFVRGVLDRETVRSVRFDPPFVSCTDGIGPHGHWSPPRIRLFVGNSAHVVVVPAVFDSETTRLVDRFQRPRERVAVDPRRVVDRILSTE